MHGNYLKNHFSCENSNKNLNKKKTYEWDRSVIALLETLCTETVTFHCHIPHSSSANICLVLKLGLQSKAKAGGESRQGMCSCSQDSESNVSEKHVSVISPLPSSDLWGCGTKKVYTWEGKVNNFHLTWLPSHWLGIPTLNVEL